MGVRARGKGERGERERGESRVIGEGRERVR